MRLALFQGDRWVCGKHYKLRSSVSRRYTTSTARGSVGLVVREGGRGGEEKRSGGEGIRGGAVEGGS